VVGTTSSEDFLVFGVTTASAYRPLSAYRPDSADTLLRQLTLTYNAKPQLFTIFAKKNTPCATGNKGTANDVKF